MVHHKSQAELKLAVFAVDQKSSGRTALGVLLGVLV